jgi:hypothetical protein
MKSLTKALLLVLAGIPALVSCGAMGKIGENSKAFTAAATSKVAKISEMATNAVRPPGIKVVEVREKDLKKLPSGQEQAVAFESGRKRRSWFFGGPVDFKEPNLPTGGTEADGSLLPPKTE